MPKKTANNSGLFNRLGNEGRKAFESHKADQTEYGAGGDLPPGIEGGVAKLTRAWFGQYEKGDNKGEYFFMAQGVVLSPKTHDGQHIEGSHTRIGPEPICATPTRSRKTIEEHMAWVLNELRKLGLETDDLEPDQIEDACAALSEDGPTFKFHTWQGDPTPQYPDPRVNHQWNGRIDYEETDGDDVVDETGDAEDADEAPPPKAAKKSAKAAKGKPTATDAAEDVPFGDELDSLGDSADSGDEDAQRELTDRAEAAGVDTEEVEGAGSWGEVVEMIRSAGEGDDETESEEVGAVDDDLEALGEAADGGDEDATARLSELAEEAGLDADEYATWAELAEALGEGGEEGADEVEPAEGDVWMFKPPKSKKAVEAEITKVFAGKRTVNLKVLDSNKTFKAVSWDDIDPA